MLESLYESIVEVKYKNIVSLKEILIYYIILIKINNDFKKKLTKVYIKNS